jgi:hypothetical protein
VGIAQGPVRNLARVPSMGTKRGLSHRGTLGFHHHAKTIEEKGEQ